MQLTDYDDWVRRTLLPKARTDFRLTPERYQLAMERYGVGIRPARAAMAHEAFNELQRQMVARSAQPSDDSRVARWLKSHHRAGRRLRRFAEYVLASFNFSFRGGLHQNVWHCTGAGATR